MFSFGHQDAYPREEPYCETYSYDANWEGNQNHHYDQQNYRDDRYYENCQDQSQQQHQFYDQSYYQDDCYYENYEDQPQQPKHQESSSSSSMESLLVSFMAEQDRKMKGLEQTLEQLVIRNKILKDQLEQQAIATTNECRDEGMKVVTSYHQEVQVYEAYSCSALFRIDVEDDQDTRMLSTPEQPVCEDGFEAVRMVAKACTELEDDESCTNDVSEYEDTSPSTTTASPGHLDEQTEENIVPPVSLAADEVSKDYRYEDFVDVYLSSITEDPRIRIDVIVKENFEVWEREFLAKEYTGSVLVGASSEDIYLDTQPPDKFRQFLPYVLKLLLGSFYSPLVLKGLKFLKGLHALLNVHVILDGRKFKWDLKVD